MLYRGWGFKTLVSSTGRDQVLGVLHETTSHRSSMVCLHCLYTLVAGRPPSVSLGLGPLNPGFLALTVSTLSPTHSSGYNLILTVTWLQVLTTSDSKLGDRCMRQRDGAA